MKALCCWKVDPQTGLPVLCVAKPKKSLLNRGSYFLPPTGSLSLLWYSIVFLPGLGRAISLSCVGSEVNSGRMLLMWIPCCD